MKKLTIITDQASSKEVGNDIQSLLEGFGWSLSSTDVWPDAYRIELQFTKPEPWGSFPGEKE